jgi:hypothetical protein
MKYNKEIMNNKFRIFILLQLFLFIHQDHLQNKNQINNQDNLLYFHNLNSILHQNNLLIILLKHHLLLHHLILKDINQLIIKIKIMNNLHSININIQINILLHLYQHLNNNNI